MSGYTSLAAYYDILTPDVGYDSRAQYCMDLLGENGVKGGILLDLACGTGSMSIPFAQSGFEVIGVDSSPDMLCEAQGKAYEAGQNILFLCQPMESLDLYGTVDCAVCTLDSLNHVTDPAAVREIFKRVSMFLNPGGLFLFDVNTVYKHEKILGNQTFVFDTDEVYCVWQNQYDEETRTVDIDLDFFEPDGDSYYRSSEQFSERAYTHEELSEWLKAADLEIIGYYGEMTKQPPKDDEQRVIYLARCVKE